MSDEEKVEKIVAAAYVCFTKHGLRRTTMADIASEAGMSRPAVYQYVANKQEAFQLMADWLLSETLKDFQAALDGEGSPTERLSAALTIKLDLTLRVWRESPHAEELLGSTATLPADLLKKYDEALLDSLTAAVTSDFPDADAREFAELLLALVHGLEAESTDPKIPIRRLHQGVTLLVSGLNSQSKESQ